MVGWFKLKQLAAWLFAPADEYGIARWLFLKGLALVYLIAFASLAVQITGLIGPDGILPFKDLLASIISEHGHGIWWRIPTIFWLSAENWVLHAAAILGCALAILLFLGYWQGLSLILLFLLYLSFYHAGQTFLFFQWDTLLLESGFLAIFLLNGSNRLIIFLYHWLLFKLRFMSGVSKLTVGDPSWLNFSALNYYFETQPLPHIGSWYFHHFPEWLHKSGTAFVFFSELIVPFFIFLPRRFRIFAALLTIMIQIMIIASSNHNFVNLLTILLCLFLLDDRFFQRLKVFQLKIFQGSPRKTGILYQSLLSISAIMIISASLISFYPMLTGQATLPWLNRFANQVGAYGIGHIYHIFPTMQIERHELQVEGSLDGRHWQAYTFHHKPGDLDQAPDFNVPHHPRLDWMMWFVPAQHPPNMYWFQRFLQRLRENSPEVTALLKDNPFKDQAPVFLRAQVYRYRFTTPEERAKSGQWWQREYLGLFPYVPPRRP